MSEIQKFRTLNKLKSVYRSGSIKERHESSAEHSWSCLILADFFLSNNQLKIDKLKIYDLLIYHDIVEIEAGDIPAHLIKQRKNKEEKELQAAKKLQKKLPNKINNKFMNLFIEFEEQKTLESKFAKAIDVLDPLINQLDNKDNKWKRLPKKTLIERKLKYFKDFPEIEKVFFEIIEFAEKNNYYK